MKNNIKWIVGIVLLLTSLICLVFAKENPVWYLVFLCYGLGAVVCIPPFLLFLETKLKKQIPSYLKYIIVIVSISLGGAIAPPIPQADTSGKDAVSSELKADEKLPQTEAKAEEKKIICDFKKMYMDGRRTKTDELLIEKTFDQCFEMKSDASTGLYTMYNIKNNTQDEEAKIHISFTKDIGTNLVTHLDIKLGNSEPTRWRRNEGHDIMMVDNAEKLTLVFGDRKVSKIKGSIVFYK